MMIQFMLVVIASGFVFTLIYKWLKSVNVARLPNLIFAWLVERGEESHGPNSLILIKEESTQDILLKAKNKEELNEDLRMIVKSKTEVELAKSKLTEIEDNISKLKIESLEMQDSYTLAFTRLIETLQILEKSLQRDRESLAALNSEARDSCISLLYGDMKKHTSDASIQCSDASPHYACISIGPTTRLHLWADSTGISEYNEAIQNNIKSVSHKGTNTPTQRFVLDTNIVTEQFLGQPSGNQLHNLNKLMILDKASPKYLFPSRDEIIFGLSHAFTYDDKEVIRNYENEAYYLLSNGQTLITRPGMRSEQYTSNISLERRGHCPNNPGKYVTEQLCWHKCSHNHSITHICKRSNHSLSYEDYSEHRTRNIHGSMINEPKETKLQHNREDYRVLRTNTTRIRQEHEGNHNSNTSLNDTDWISENDDTTPKSAGRNHPKIHDNCDDYCGGNVFSLKDAIPNFAKNKITLLPENEVFESSNEDETNILKYETNNNKSNEIRNDHPGEPLSMSNWTPKDDDHADRRQLCLLSNHDASPRSHDENIPVQLSRYDNTATLRTIHQVMESNEIRMEHPCEPILNRTPKDDDPVDKRQLCLVSNPASRSYNENILVMPPQPSGYDKTVPLRTFHKVMQKMVDNYKPVISTNHESPSKLFRHIFRTAVQGFVDYEYKSYSREVIMDANIPEDELGKDKEKSIVFILKAMELKNDEMISFALSPRQKMKLAVSIFSSMEGFSITGSRWGVICSEIMKDINANFTRLFSHEVNYK